MQLSILILNFNGKDLLQKFLPSIIDAAKKSKHECKVAVVDNKSSDRSVEFLKENFPTVKTFIAKENRILCSYNEVLGQLEDEVVILLNNDIKVKDDFVDYLTEHFTDKNTFFVAPKILNFDGTYNGGKSHLFFKFGIIRADVDRDNFQEPGYTQSISTGAFRRDLFLKLGGFDSIYLPGIWEEVDICYRAALRGKKGFYEPRSIIWHDESTTFNREFGARKKIVLAHRNMFLFFWKNISDSKLIAKHILFLPFRLLHSILFDRAKLAEGFLGALPKLSAALSLRRNSRLDSENLILKDKDIIR